MRLRWVYASGQWASLCTVELRWAVCGGTELELAVSERVSCREYEMIMVNRVSLLKYPPSVRYSSHTASRIQSMTR